MNASGVVNRIESQMRYHTNPITVQVSFESRIDATENTSILRVAIQEEIDFKSVVLTGNTKFKLIYNSNGDFIKKGPSQ